MSPDILRFEDREVRMVAAESEPWWVAKDVCDALGLTDTSKSVEKLDEDEKGTNTIRTPGGEQTMLCVNEAGLYTLILRSRKPEAKRFKRWVTHEVLPQIRKTGSFAPVPVDPILALASGVVQMREQQIVLETRVQAIEEKVNKPKDRKHRRAPQTIRDECTETKWQIWEITKAPPGKIMAAAYKVYAERTGIEVIKTAKAEGFQYGLDYLEAKGDLKLLREILQSELTRASATPL
jgi:prophage antirepressor-like protein